MLLPIDWNQLRSGGLASVMSLLMAGMLVPAAPALAQSAPQTGGLPDLTQLVEQVGPAVVNIRTLERRTGQAQLPPGMDEEMQEFFRRFFGQPMPGGPRKGLGLGLDQVDRKLRSLSEEVWARASSSVQMVSS